MVQFDYRKKELIPAPLKHIKFLVRTDEALISPFVDELFQLLRRENSDVRVAILLLCNHFFQRSHRFRQEIVENLQVSLQVFGNVFLTHLTLQDLMLLTVELDPLHHPLPGPPAAAKELKKEALTVLSSWVEKFSAGYAKLENAEQYLSTNCKHFDFKQGSVDNLAERRCLERERLKAEVKAKKSTDKVLAELEEKRPEMEQALMECRSAIELAFPRFVELEGGVRGLTSARTSGEANLRLHGYSDSSAEISVPIFPSGRPLVEWSEENNDLLNSLQDSKALMGSYLLRVNHWLTDLAAAGGYAQARTLTQQIIELKTKLAHELERMSALKVAERIPEMNGSDDSSSDDGDWIEVGNDEANQAAEEEPGPSTSIPQPQADGVEKVPEIPTLPFGLDLQYWGHGKLDHPRPHVPQVDSHPFWRPSRDDDFADRQSGSHMQAYTSRVITFVGKRPTGRRKCGAKLKTGKDGKVVLCPRRDFHRCPLHGPIIDRDDKGVALTEEGRAADMEREQEREEREAKSLRRDIAAVTGYDLGIDGSRAKWRSKNLGRKREKSEAEKRRDSLEVIEIG